MESYSAINKNEMMPFTVTWMGLEIIILSEVREKQTPYDITLYVESKKNGTSELIYKTEIESQM